MKKPSRIVNFNLKAKLFECKIKSL